MRTSLHMSAILFSILVELEIPVLSGEEPFSWGDTSDNILVNLHQYKVFLKKWVWYLKSLIYLEISR